MKSADQIVECILRAIARLYAQPHETAYTVAGLDGILYQLHWLLADATDRLDEFVEARTAVLDTDMSDWKKVHLAPDFHAVVDEPEKFSALISEWQKLDVTFGIATKQGD